MRAIVFEQPGDESVLRLGEVERPAAGAGEIRIRVRTTSVNRADLLQRQGLYPPPPGASPILGLECAGEIVEIGPGAEGWKVGDRVMALLPGGGYAEQASVHGGSAMRAPGAFSDREAGAFCEVFLTAFLNIFQLGAVPPGGSVLVHGGGSGVGTAAIRLCKEAGLRIIVTAGSEAKCQRCRTLGADYTINYNDGDFATEVREASGGKGVDVVLDCVGGRYLGSNLKALALDGRLVIIGLMGGARAEIDLAGLLVRRQQVIGSTLRSRSAEDKAAIVRAFLARFGDALEAGRRRPVIDRALPLERAAEAHRAMAKNEHFGKIALLVEPAGG
jgi:putative PIG3 family NAD(P)H quinone oxidoreductase